jgi:hypothetical protein
LQTIGLPGTARKQLLRACLKKALPALPNDVQAETDSELERMGTMPDPRQMMQN